MSEKMGAVVPSDHATRHENGGGDEISVAGLSGVLADPQTPADHASTHENGGGDEISVAGLSGLLADPQTPLSHAASHQNGGADEISVAGLSGLLADFQKMEIREDNTPVSTTRTVLDFTSSGRCTANVSDIGGVDPRCVINFSVDAADPWEENGNEVLLSNDPRLHPFENELVDSTVSGNTTSTSWVNLGTPLSYVPSQDEVVMAYYRGYAIVDNELDGAGEWSPGFSVNNTTLGGVGYTGGLVTTGLISTDGGATVDAVNKMTPFSEFIILSLTSGNTYRFGFRGRSINYGTARRIDVAGRVTVYKLREA